MPPASATGSGVTVHASACTFTLTGRIESR
jgi:hypothetical protein